MVKERRQHVVQVTAVPHKHPVQTLGPDGSYPPFGVRVRFRRPRRDFDRLDASRGEHRIEGSAELGVAVADEKPELVGVFVEVHEQVTCRLGNPGSGGVGGDAGQVYPAVVEFDDEEHV